VLVTVHRSSVLIWPITWDYLAFNYLALFTSISILHEVPTKCSRYTRIIQIHMRTRSHTHPHIHTNTHTCTHAHIPAVRKTTSAPASPDHGTCYRRTRDYGGREECKTGLIRIRRACDSTENGVQTMVNEFGRHGMSRRLNL
jgi:hypothetical protein